MSAIHQDIDILKYEPGLFSSTAFGNQCLGKGTNGIVSGTSFSASGGDFINKGVTAGGVIFMQSLDGTINAAYEIVSVNSATQLTISVVRGDAAQAPIAVGTASGLIYRILTFAPQAAEAAFALSQRMGLKPGYPDGQYGFEDLTDVSVLKQASVFTALAIIYSGLYGSGTVEDNIWSTYQVKQEHYESCAEAAIQRCQLSLEG